jgi:hypothetical protein
MRLAVKSFRELHGHVSYTHARLFLQVHVIVMGFLKYSFPKNIYTLFIHQFLEASTWLMLTHCCVGYFKAANDQNAHHWFQYIVENAVQQWQNLFFW